MRRSLMYLLPGLLLVTGSSTVAQAQEAPAPVQGQLGESELGNALAALGLKPTKTEKRYDFAFKTSYRGEEWKFSMSAVLSRDEKSIWVMAWLDPIPASAAEVPRTALLRLLAANDRLGGGKFFAYIPGNKRFVLQRVVPNVNMDTAAVRAALQDLAVSVAEEYPTWAVANWSPTAAETIADGAASGRNAPRNPTAAARLTPTRTSDVDSSFSESRIK